jgi:hypothetical protein
VLTNCVNLFQDKTPKAAGPKATGWFISDASVQATHASVRNGQAIGLLAGGFGPPTVRHNVTF